MARHHRLSPSGSDRWSTCTMSVFLTLKNNLKSTSSIYAEEGTFLHDMIYRQLTRQLNPSLYNMREIMDVNSALQMFYNNQDFTPNKFLLKFEVFVNIKLLDMSITGTADVVGISKKRLLIVDWKFGKGLLVHVGNSMFLYALGVYQSLLSDEEQQDIEEFILCIIQPRYKTYPHYECIKLNRKELGEKLKPLLKAVKQIKNKHFEYHPSFSNCFFCPAKKICENSFNANEVTHKQAKDAFDLFQEAEPNF